MSGLRARTGGTSPSRVRNSMPFGSYPFSAIFCAREGLGFPSTVRTLQATETRRHEKPFWCAVSIFDAKRRVLPVCIINLPFRGVTSRNRHLWLLLTTCYKLRFHIPRLIPVNDLCPAVALRDPHQALARCQNCRRRFLCAGCHAQI